VDSGHGSSGEAGQASVELVAVLPALVVCVLIAGHLVSAGWALWSAANAARAGTRADAVGGNARRAARSALPAALRRDASVSGEERTRVSVPVPALLPGARLGRLSGTASLDVEPE
jgi:pilus assembly protein CpaE